MKVCSACFDRQTMTVEGLSGSLGPFKCDVCEKRQASLLVSRKIPPTIPVYKQTHDD